MNINNK